MNLVALKYVCELELHPEYNNRMLDDRTRWLVKGDYNLDRTYIVYNPVLNHISIDYLKGVQNGTSTK